MRKVELSEDELDQVVGGSLFASCSADAEYGTLTQKDLNGKVIAVYHFDPAHAMDVYGVVFATGKTEEQKISEMSKWFV